MVLDRGAASLDGVDRGGDRRRLGHRPWHRRRARRLRRLGRRSGSGTRTTCAAAADEIGGLACTTDVRESDQVDAALARTIDELGPVTDPGQQRRRRVLARRSSTPRRRAGTRSYRANLTPRAALHAAGRPGAWSTPASAGSIINVTSIEGVRAAPGYAAYAAAKAGVINSPRPPRSSWRPTASGSTRLAPDITLTEGMRAVAPPGFEERLRPHGADGPGRPRRRDGRRRGVPRLGPVELRHRPDDPRRRRHRTPPAAGTTTPTTATTSSGPPGLTSAAA